VVPEEVLDYVYICPLAPPQRRTLAIGQRRQDSDNMSPAQERPHRRHRAAYRAPSAGQWHQQQRQQPRRQPAQATPNYSVHDEETGLSFEDSLSDLGIPLMLEVPQQNTITVSPPSSAEGSSNEFREQLLEGASNMGGKSFGMQLMDVISGMYNGFVDFFLLVVVCFMGCFFYDVEVKVVHSDRAKARVRGRRGRVIIQTDDPPEPHHGVMTNLLRTPPRSGNFSIRSSNRSDTRWENIV